MRTGAPGIRGIYPARRRRAGRIFRLPLNRRTFIKLPQPERQTIILAAVPRPAHVVAFEYAEESQDLVLPPTYYNYSGLFETVKEDLADFLERRVSLDILRAPLKTLAAWTGFAKYGCNNLAFVESMGSYVQLVGLATDVALAGGASADPSRRSMLERCRTCRACVKACPVDAISDERFLLYADRCLTFHSELNGDLPAAFGRLRPPCVVGCMVCQECCPENKGRLRFERLGVPFTEEETSVILGDSEDHPPSQVLIDKVAGLRSTELKMTEEGPSQVFRRNVAAVLKRHKPV